MNDYVAYNAQYSKYIRDRITELRMKKGISEYRMSSDLGQNKNYIQGITSGKSLPSMTQFLNICEYFDLTPMQFFDGDTLYPQKVRRILNELQDLDEPAIDFFLNAILFYKHTTP